MSCGEYSSFKECVRKNRTKRSPEAYCAEIQRKVEGQKRVDATLGKFKEKSRGQGIGVGGPRQGDGGADKCVCPECGSQAAKKKGVPCTSLKCPKCNVPMKGDAKEREKV